MTKLREPLTLEFVLHNILKNLSDDDLKVNLGKTRSHFLKCADPDDENHNLSFEDAIKIESLLINAGKGSPLIDFFNAYLDSKKDNRNYFDSINSNLINIGGRLGDVMDVIQESSSLDSESGKSISKTELDKIHKAIMLLEEKIKNLKLSIK